MNLLRKKMGPLVNPTARPSLYLYLSLRLLQFGATTLTLAYFCSLIGWHNCHYCSTRFYKDQCYEYQQYYSKVPTLYIVFVATLSCMILVAFGLSFRQLSSFLSFATNSKSPIDSSNSGTDDLNPDGLVVDDSFPIVKLCKRAFRSVPNSALLIDSAVFIVLSLSLNEYWTSVIRPNHMHPGSGYAFPVCWLFEPRRQIGNEYWKNLRVEKQRCTDNLISFYGRVALFFRVFTSMLVVVDAFYLNHEWSQEKVLDDNVLVEASVHEKGLLIPPTT